MKGKRLMIENCMKVIIANDKEAVQFVTPLGVNATIATSIPPELLTALARKLERKLRRSGHMPNKVDRK